MSKREASLWVGPRSLPCVSWAHGARGKESCESWIFRLHLPAKLRRQDERIHGPGRPFTGFFFSRAPAGMSVQTVQVFAPRAQQVTSSFEYHQEFCAVVENLAHDTDIELVLGLGPAKPAPARQPAPAYPEADRPAVARLRRFGHAFLLERRRLPACSEIAAGLDLSLPEVVRLARLTHAPVCDEDVTQGALPRLRILSSPEDDSGDFIEDKMVVSPSDEAISMNLSEDTRRVLKTLSPREEKVLRMRFGIGEKSDHTLEEVGQNFDITREKIRPISASALRKLRHPSRSKRLKDFIED